MAFDQKQIEALSAPLSRAHVKTRTMAGRTMSYVEGWHVIAEANRIFGFDGWTSETVLLQETNRDLVDLKGSNGPYKQWRIGYIAKVRITVGNISREGTGYGSGMGKPEAIGDAVEGAIKEAETDARKRALMTFGSSFGLALYDKDQTDVEDAPPKALERPAQAEQPVSGYQLASSQPKPSTPPKMTPKHWAQDALDTIRTLKGEALDAWQEANAKALVKLYAAEPTLHRDIIALIQQRQALFAPANSG